MVLTLKPDTYAAILRAAKAANVFGSGLVASMLDDMVPMLNSLAEATQAAKEKRVEAFDHLAESLGVAQVAAAQTQLEFNRTRRAHTAKDRSTSRKKKHA